MEVDHKAVRAWAKENRPEYNLGVRGRIPDNVLEDYKLSTETDQEIVDGFLVDEEIPVRELEEAKPVKQKTHKIRDFFTPKAKPVSRQKRVPVDSVFSVAYSIASKVVGAVPGKDDVPALLPVARVMEMQAPAVGLIVDDVVKGTIFDKVLQPVAKTGKAGESLFGIIGPPMLVGAIMTQPSMQPVYLPMLRESLKSYVLVAGPAMRKQKEKEAKLIAELGGDVDSSIDDLIKSIFADPRVEGQVNDTEGRSS
jgi:hypothetical protein